MCINDILQVQERTMVDKGGKGESFHKWLKEMSFNLEKRK
jgi:hypothetical protein